MIFAEHSNGTIIHGNGRVIIPENLLEVRVENFENGNSFFIAECSFFDRLVGVQKTASKAKKEIIKNIENYLSRYNNNNVISGYLRDKGFTFNTYGSLVAGNLTVTTH